MLTLAIDIGGTFIKHALVASDWSTSEQGKEPTPETLDDFWAVLDHIISSHQDVSAIAISCPGEINNKRGYVYRGGLIPFLTMIPLAVRLQNDYQLPVTVINDADAAALAEARMGVLSEATCGAAFVLGTGVGLGLVSQGQLLPSLSLPQFFRGPSSQSPDRVQASQQWEMLKRAVFNLFDNTGSAVGFVHEASRLLDLASDDGIAVFAALDRRENKDLQDLFRKYCHDIALLIFNLQSYLMIDRVAIGGGISAQPRLLEELQRQYDLLFEQTGTQDFQPLTIQACHFQNTSNLIGAVCHFLSLKEQGLL